MQKKLFISVFLILSFTKILAQYNCGEAKIDCDTFPKCVCIIQGDFKERIELIYNDYNGFKKYEKNDINSITIWFRPDGDHGVVEICEDGNTLTYAIDEIYEDKDCSNIKLHLKKSSTKYYHLEIDANKIELKAGLQFVNNQIKYIEMLVWEISN